MHPTIRSETASANAPGLDAQASSFAIGDTPNFEAFGRPVAEHSEWFDAMCALGKLAPEASNGIAFKSKADRATPSIVVRELFAQVVCPNRDSGDDIDNVESINFGSSVERIEDLIPRMLAAMSLLLFADAAVREDRTDLNSALGLGLSARNVVRTLFDERAGTTGRRKRVRRL
jgi:hypothetical protein